MGGDNGWFSDNADQTSNSQATDNSSNQNYKDGRSVTDGASAAVTGDNSSLSYLTAQSRTENTAIDGSFNSTTTITDGGSFDLLAEVNRLNAESIKNFNASAVAVSANAGMVAAEAIAAEGKTAAAASEAMSGVSENSINAAIDMSNNSMNFGSTAVNSALSFGSSSMSDMLGFGRDVLKLQVGNQEMISETQKGVESAYKTAASISTGQENIVKVGLVVAGLVGLVALSSLMRKA